MNKETQSILTGMLGGLLVSITVSGHFTSYVRPGFRPVLLAAGIVLILVGVASLILTIRDEVRAEKAKAAQQELGAAAGQAPRQDTHDHGHHHGRSKAPWLIMAPVLVLLLVAPPALGDDAANRSADCSVPASDGAAYANRRTDPSPPLPAGNPAVLTMKDFIARALYDSSYSTVTTDVQVVAFVSADRCDSSGYNLVRMVIACCAADAYALRIHVDSASPYPGNTWVQATIRAVKDSGDEGNNYVPSATVIAMTRIAQPADPYET